MRLCCWQWPSHMAASRSTYTLVCLNSLTAACASSNTLKYAVKIVCTICALSLWACEEAPSHEPLPHDSDGATADGTGRAGRGGSSSVDAGSKADAGADELQAGRQAPEAGSSAAVGGSGGGPRGGTGGRDSAGRGNPGEAGSGGPGGQGGQGGQGGSAGDESPGARGGAGGAGEPNEPSEPDPEQGAAGSGGQGGQGGQGGEAEAGSGGQAGDGLPTQEEPEPEPTADPTYLNAADRSSSDVVISADRLSAEWLGLATLGVRSTTAVRPRSGVFYFEAYADLDLFSIGVAPGRAALDHGAATGGGFSIDVSGVIELPQGEGPAFQRSAQGEYGFVVDYRGDHPTVYLITGTRSAARLAATQALTAISEPLYIHLSGLRRKQGNQVTINPGNDTVNQPFVFDPRAVLRAAGQSDAAQALVLGWGATHAGMLNQPPELSLLTTPPSLVNVGESVTLMAAAADAEGGVSDADIQWDVLSIGIGPERVHATGAAFTFKPEALGRHPIRVSVADAGGKRVEHTVTIEADGTLQQFSSVALVNEPGLTGAGIQLSSDGLRAHWTRDQKLGVRANQGLYGDFWYVEGHRLVPEDNQAIGLVIGGVSLNPYQFNTTPPSCSINTTGPSVFHDLMYAQSNPPSNVEYYGMAVDYRGDYPIVYVVIGGQLATTLHLTDVTVPIYPMLYGNVNSHGAAYDMEINFGGSSFHEDPIAVLDRAGIDSAGLKLCWGNANSACR